MPAEDHNPLKLHFRLILFVLKLWLLLNIFCPLVIWLPIFFKERDFSIENLAGTFFLMAIGLAFSLPGMVVLFLAMWKCTVRRIFLIPLMAAIIAGSFLAVDVRFFTRTSNFVYPLIYFVTSTVLILIMKIPQKNFVK